MYYCFKETYLTSSSGQKNNLKMGAAGSTDHC